MTAPWRPASPAWLLERPIAHRGLHDRAAGRIENSLTAARAALAAGYAIECDVRRSADGEVFVFHDAGLSRLTMSTGRLSDIDGRRVGALALAGSTDRIAALTALFDVVSGAVPIICEIKSEFDGDMRLADRLADLAAAYPGPLALKSFDPAVLVYLRRRGVDRPLGLVGEASFDGPDWADLPPARKREMVTMLHVGETRPDFLSFHVDDMPHAVPCLMRTGVGVPVMAWTVRTAEQRQIAARWADQIVFEGFTP